jgi:D-alanyl-D-alanine dipeptidase
MNKLLLILFLPLLVLAQNGDDELINPKELIPDLVVDLRYNSNDHKFLNLPDGDIDLPKFYTANECLVLLVAAKGLKIAQDTLRNIRTHNNKSYPYGIGLKVWDAYRPRAVQYLFWEIYPNGTYIANPATGSKHNRGGAVDVTLIDLSNGEELQMPTEFDDFSDTASHNYTNLPSEVLANRTLLKSIMTEIANFNLYSAEWWHYEVTGASNYPLRDFQLK